MADAPVPARPSNKLTKAQVLYEHPLYAQWKATWQKLAHVREGTGGFLDGTYLIAHPREWEDYKSEDPIVPTKKLKARRKLARYENFAATIIDTTKAALFRRTPTRIVGEKDKPKPSALEKWWQDVDGAGTHIDDFLAQTWDPSGTFGHTLLYMDRPNGQPAATAADAEAPFLRVYTPLDVIDWLEDDRGNLTAVKFLEAAPRTAFEQKLITEKDIRIRVVTETYWALYDRKGDLVGGGEVDGLHEMGVLPVVELFGRRRPLLRRIGQSLLKDPQLFIDLYNLTSELRELLRNQTFSILNIPLGSGQDAMSVSDAEALLSKSGFGTDRVLFSGLQAQFIAGEVGNITAYQDERDKLLRAIYRLTGLSWEADSKDAEAEGSLKLKREDLNQALAALADEVEKADYAIARLFYYAERGKDAGDKAFEVDEITIRYPDEFDPTPFAQILEQAQAAQTLRMPIEVMRAILKRLIPQFLPDLLPDEIKTLEAAVDAMKENDPAEDIRQRIASVFGGKAPAEGGKQEPPEPEKEDVAA